ncbi:MAG: YigZ family protein [Clostridium sp.]|nr:YigZ family protein [Clostridium sp.]
MDKVYKTVLKCGQHEIEERKSRFIATVKPVTEEDEAIEFISGLKTRYWDATHNVYAYLVMGDSIIQRFSDDGEPSGTAGLPMMEVIKKMGIRDLVVVVTRYFGGTQLGASGLIRAYSKSAIMGIEAAQIVTKKLCGEMSIVLEYPQLGRVQNLLISEGFPIKDIAYEQDVEIKVFVPWDKIHYFTDIVTEATSAHSTIKRITKTYITLDSQGRLILD